MEPTSGGVLLADDQADIRTYLAGILRQGGYLVHEVAYAEEALEVMKDPPFEFVCAVIDVDFGSSRMRGTEALATLRESSPDFPVILLTASGTTEELVQALRKGGATAFLEKGLYVGEILPIAIAQVGHVASLRAKVRRCASEFRSDWRSVVSGIEEGESLVLLGESESARALSAEIEGLGAAEGPVLITGERGSGRRAAAHEIHVRRSPSAPYSQVNCSLLSSGPLPPPLDPEGSFPHAPADAGNGGLRTVLLTEVDRIDPGLQPSLLAAIKAQSGIRLLSTASRSQDELESADLLLPELLAELGKNRLAIPPLRDRSEDIEALIRVRARLAAARWGRDEPITLDPEALEVLLSYSWPGNGFEVKLLIEQLTVSHEDAVVGMLELPPHILGSVGVAGQACTDERLRERLIRDALRITQGDTEAVSRALRLTEEERIRNGPADGNGRTEDAGADGPVDP